MLTCVHCVPFPSLQLLSSKLTKSCIAPSCLVPVVCRFRLSAYRWCLHHREHWVTSCCHTRAYGEGTQRMTVTHLDHKETMSLYCYSRHPAATLANCFSDLSRSCPYLVLCISGADSTIVTTVRTTFLLTACALGTLASCRLLSLPSPACSPTLRISSLDLLLQLAWSMGQSSPQGVLAACGGLQLTQASSTVQLQAMQTIQVRGVFVLIYVSNR